MALAPGARPWLVGEGAVVDASTQAADGSRVWPSAFLASHAVGWPQGGVWGQHGAGEGDAEATVAEHMLLRGIRSLAVAQPGEELASAHSGAGGELHLRQAVLRRTVYVRNLDVEVTEAHLLRVFGSCGGVQDSRLCSDPHSTLRYAFLQLDTEEAVSRALALSGSLLGRHSIKVSKSRTAIVPINSSLLPRSEEEQERCRRTAYVTNLDADLNGPTVHAFFDRLCGPVARVHVTRMQRQSTAAAFVEFADVLGADRALSCGGARIRHLPIRVSPSKTPLQTREPRGGQRHAGWGPGHGRRASPERPRFRGLGQDHPRRQEVIRRTVFIRGVDTLVSDLQLLRMFGACGNVVDHRMCADPNELGMRWAFIQFDSEEAVSGALTFDGAVLGSHSIKVVRSRTAILPVHSPQPPRSEEVERCMRTVHVTNVDTDCAPGEVAAFFAQHCGEVTCLDLTQPEGQDTQAALVEYATPGGATLAVRCAGQHIKSLPIGVSPLYGDSAPHRAALHGSHSQRGWAQGRRGRSVAVRRTIFVRDLGLEVSEEAVVQAFSPFGAIEECRMCSDPNCAALRFAFIQYESEEAVGMALTLDGSSLGGHDIRVARSRTAIVPVNSSLLPRSAEEVERCRRTVHVTNLDINCPPGQVAAFFVQHCGEVARIHVAQHAHGMQVAFVEFAEEESAARALNCGGARIQAQPIRVGPSKTPLALSH